MVYLVLILLTIQNTIRADEMIPDIKGLVCRLEISPQEVGKGEPVNITCSLKNISLSPLPVCRDIFWFRLRIADSNGAIVANGMDNRFLPEIDDLPLAEIYVLQPGEKISTSTRAVIDNGSFDSIFNSYSLDPGVYNVSVIYRVEPGKEPEGADILIPEEDKPRIWKGVLESNSVKIKILPGKNTGT
jgi:hypothetical protein